MQVQKIGALGQRNLSNISRETNVKSENNVMSSQVESKTPLATLLAYSGVNKVSFKGESNDSKQTSVIIFFGPPNSGKGTYSKATSREFGFPQISTGDLIRAEIKKDTEFGQQFKDYSNKGLLAPDKLVIDVLKKRIAQDDCQKGFILDGFPRTVAQAKELDNMLKAIPNSNIKVLNLDVPDEILFERSANRWTCPDCGSTYNAKKIPELICEDDGAKLMKRADDTPEVMAQRLVEYNEKTFPLIEFYSNKDGVLSDVEVLDKKGNELLQSAIVDSIKSEIEEFVD